MPEYELEPGERVDLDSGVSVTRGGGKYHWGEDQYLIHAPVPDPVSGRYDSVVVSRDDLDKIEILAGVV